ncbi:MAG: LysM domain-containing protein [Candidatus Viridilinea halotolerans]|uniref:LysM domain-containing protein n=1 Tax=Candidatus Viridilinea halotolerans TaxID=2491704 RepID=A0A426U0Q6_9CHLR|nr:MAG: LysM domain-containing protein [Candidatus Viridilinea halotolerans]
MSSTVVYLLLFSALVLPVPAALLLRLFNAQLGVRGLFVGAGLIFALAIAATLALSRAEVGMLRVGDLTLLLPSARRSDGFTLPPVDVAPPVPPEGTAAPTPFAPPTLTPRPSVTPTPRPTLAPTAIPEPTPEPEPTLEPTPEPAPEPEPAPPAAVEPQRYTVAEGDTFRGIAERFGVSVADLLQANNLTPEQADNLRLGQELVIP